MISLPRQRLISVVVLAAAFSALGLAAYYQDDDKLANTTYVGIDQVTNGVTPGAGGGSAESATTLAPGGNFGSNPIELFLPSSGDAVACQGPVGVDLIPGYGARLTINGREVPEEAMNVNLNSDGSISSTITASRSIGQYTFTPDEGCPNGQWLRPVDNVLEVCVFRLDDPARACTVSSEYVFNAA